MKIYISGQITGLPFNKVEAKFQEAEYLLQDLDFEPINHLKNGLTTEHHWNEHMVRDIELLLPCDGILMLDNWTESKGAGIEKFIAETLGMKILFESTIVRNQDIVLAIQNAIQEITGLAFADYTTKSRNREAFFARMIFTYQCYVQRLKIPIIAGYIKRDRTVINHCLKKYKDEIKYNPYFRDLALQVEEKLTPKTQEYAKA